MKTLKQIIKEIESYQCVEGNNADIELRSLIIKVDLLFDAFMLFDAYIKRYENPQDFIKFIDELLFIFNKLNSSLEAVQNRIGKGLEQISIFQCLQSINIVFDRKELLTKYEGSDKKFVETITKDIDEYIASTYGK